MKRVFLRGNTGEFDNYLAALTACGLEPVLSMDLERSGGCDGLLLPGGADVDPGRYQQENRGSVGIESSRDENELTLLRWFMDWGKPVLGICRGCQVINIGLGGTLHQDIPDHSRIEGVDRVHPAMTEHPVFRQLYGERLVCNSSHHQSVDRLGAGLSVLCRAEDGTVEGIIHENGRVLGVQFHPERMAFGLRRPDADDGEPIFRYFASLLDK